MMLIGRGQHLGFIDEVDLQGLQDLRFHEVPNTHLGHDGDGNRFLDLGDLGGISHAGHTALRPYVGWHPLQSHDRAGTGFLSDLGLLGVGHVHDHATLERLSQAKPNA
ncbi:MAG: hypothetical protein BWY79_01059 [Actinobacteria bacterium ADurb.Bin444]|nr:MAG: hypothetical protein BWY79_01059 [Actinobacteria bacterium ADurb.Bin444]